MTRANEKNKKLEERFIKKVKEHKQANQLITENEKSIEELEKEIKTARDCLNKVFAEVHTAQIFDQDCRITQEMCNKRYLDLKQAERERMELVK